MSGHFKVQNGVRIELTDAEEATRTAYIEQHAIEKQARVEAAAQKATDKTNGNQKLLDLGLTQAEVDAITGQ
tara:strand:+ start:531 stop:746 length:216 start_codon:yes stop_codon:yes gene_type:complete